MTNSKKENKVGNGHNKKKRPEQHDNNQDNVDNDDEEEEEEEDDNSELNMSLSLSLSQSMSTSARSRWLQTNRNENKKKKKKKKMEKTSKSANKYLDCDEANNTYSSMNGNRYYGSGNNYNGNSSCNIIRSEERYSASCKHALQVLSTALHHKEPTIPNAVWRHSYVHVSSIGLGVAETIAKHLHLYQMRMLEELKNKQQSSITASNNNNNTKTKVTTLESSAHGIVTLDLRALKMRDVGLRKLLPALLHDSELQNCWLQGNRITDQGIDMLCEILKELPMTNLEALERFTSQSPITPSHFNRSLKSKVANSVNSITKTIPSLQTLVLSENPVSAAGWRVLMLHLGHFPHLTRLDIGCGNCLIQLLEEMATEQNRTTNITGTSSSTSPTLSFASTAVAAIAASVQKATKSKNVTTTITTTSNNNGTTKAKQSKGNTTVNVMNSRVELSEIDEEDVNEYIAGIDSCPSLKVFFYAGYSDQYLEDLQLSINPTHFSPRAFGKMCTRLVGNSSLHEIHFIHCYNTNVFSTSKQANDNNNNKDNNKKHTVTNITNETAQVLNRSKERVWPIKALAAALTSSKTQLRHLILTFPLNDEAVNFLARGLVSASCLSFLSLQGCEMSANALYVLGKSLERNITLVTLNVSFQNNNRIAHQTILAEKLSSSTRWRAMTSLTDLRQGSIDASATTKINASKEKEEEDEMIKQVERDARPLLRIIRALRINNTLSHLNMTGIRICNEDIEELCACVEEYRNNSLYKVNYTSTGSEALSMKLEHLLRVNRERKKTNQCANTAAFNSNKNIRQEAASSSKTVVNHTRRAANTFQRNNSLTPPLPLPATATTRRMQTATLKNNKEVWSPLEDEFALAPVTNNHYYNSSNNNNAVIKALETEMEDLLSASIVPISPMSIHRNINKVNASLSASTKKNKENDNVVNDDDDDEENVFNSMSVSLNSLSLNSTSMDYIGKTPFIDIENKNNKKKTLNKNSNNYTDPTADINYTLNNYSNNNNTVNNSSKWNAEQSAFENDALGDNELNSKFTLNSFRNSVSNSNLLRKQTSTSIIRNSSPSDSTKTEKYYSAIKRNAEHNEFKYSSQ